MTARFHNVLPLFLIPLLLLLPEPAAAGRVYVATVSGGINPAVSDYLDKSILRAETDDVDALVIELDTPGGLLSSTKDIVNRILNARVPVLVFVSPRGAWAASAGTFITLSGHVAAMAPGTSIGAAHPVSLMPGAPPVQPKDLEGEDGESEAPAARDISGEKIENFTAAFIESIAEIRDRNVEWAVDAVRNSVAITQSEALEKKVIDLVAEDVNHLLELVHGRTVTVGRDEVVLDTQAASVERLGMDWINRLFNIIADPQIAVLLVMAGLLGLYVEFSNPGLIFPGALGLVALILAGFALQILPFNSIGLVLIAAGIGLLVAEIFVASFGLLFAGGLICLAAGAYLLFDVPEQSDLVVPFWKVIAPAVAAVGVFGGVVVFALSRSMVRPQFSGSEGLVGETGVVDGAIQAGGKGRVQVRGELWSALAAESIEVGDPIEVVAVDELTLRVKRVEETPGES